VQRDGGPGGPAGGGNPTGASFTGPAQALEIIGNHAYAFSGKFSAETVDQTVFDFTSGNYYFVGELQFNGFVDDDNPGLLTGGTCQVLFNEIAILLLSIPGSDDSPHSVKNLLLIPPYTKVTATLDGGGTEADRHATVSLVGRIYRG